MQVPQLAIKTLKWKETNDTKFFPILKEPKPKLSFEKLVIIYRHPIVVVNVYIRNLPII